MAYRKEGTIVEKLRDEVSDSQLGYKQALLEEAADEIERLRELLAMYGEHTYPCPIVHPDYDGKCTCGWAAIEKELST